MDDAYVALNRSLERIDEASQSIPERTENGRRRSLPSGEHSPGEAAVSRFELDKSRQHAPDAQRFRRSSVDSRQQWLRQVIDRLLSVVIPDELGHRRVAPRDHGRAAEP